MRRFVPSLSPSGMMNSGMEGTQLDSCDVPVVPRANREDLEGTTRQIGREFRARLRPPLSKPRDGALDVHQRYDQVIVLTPQAYPRRRIALVLKMEQQSSFAMRECIGHPCCDARPIADHSLQHLRSPRSKVNRRSLRTPPEPHIPDHRGIQ